MRIFPKIIFLNLCGIKYCTHNIFNVYLCINMLLKTIQLYIFILNTVNVKLKNVRDC